MKERYPSIEIAFRCEELGMAIYEKNSSVFFLEDYMIDIEKEDSYYLSAEAALDKLSDYFGLDFKDMEETMVLVQENNEKDKGQVWVNRYEMVD